MAVELKKKHLVTTLRLPESKMKMLKAVSGIENRNMSEIIEELLDNYFVRYMDKELNTLIE